MYHERGDVYGNTTLHICAKSGNAKLLAEMLDLNLVNVNNRNEVVQTVLHVACLKA